MTETEESNTAGEIMAFIICIVALLWWAMPSERDMHMHYRQIGCEIRTYTYCGDNRVNSFSLWLDDVYKKLAQDARTDK